MGNCAGKPKKEDDPPEVYEEDLKFANEVAPASNGHVKQNGDASEDMIGNLPGIPDNPAKTPKKFALFSPFNDWKNKVYESPASVIGTPAFRLPNFSPAPARFTGTASSILERAAEKTKASRMRDADRQRQIEEANARVAGSPGGSSGTKDVMGVDKEGKPLDKKFGFQRNVGQKYELEQELGRGHFGHTCMARGKKGEGKGQEFAVKIIPKANMTTAISVEDVKKEVRILKSLAGHDCAVNFHDAFEDQLNVYIAMELCDGGELLEQILQRGGRFPEREAMPLIRQMFRIMAFCHQQGVIHRDLKPENFLFKNREPGSAIRVIDFGLSDFIGPDQRLNDIVGSAYYIAPEVLHRSYGCEADVWSLGVIAYILLSGSRPFWARTESGIFRAVLRLEPNFADQPWPSISAAAREFVKWVLSKDYRRRPTAAQALTHPWVRGGGAKIPLDLAIFRSIRNFTSFTRLRKAGMRALVKTLTEEELIYLRSQFEYFDKKNTNKISFEDMKTALQKVATPAMKESNGLDILKTIDGAKVKTLDFKEFCAAALNVFQLEVMPNWAERARIAYKVFIEAGHGHVTIEDLAKELGQNESLADPTVLEEWTNYDGTLSFLGFTRLVHGPSKSRRPRPGQARANKPKISPTSSGRMANPHGSGGHEINSIPETQEQAGAAVPAGSPADAAASPAGSAGGGYAGGGHAGGQLSGRRNSESRRTELESIRESNGSGVLEATGPKGDKPEEIPAASVATLPAVGTWS